MNKLFIQSGFIFFLMGTSFIYAHEDIQKVTIDCSTSIQSSPEYKDGEIVTIYTRTTNYAVPMNFVKNHFEIGETSWSNYKISVVAESKGSYAFKDIASLSIRNDEGKLSVIDPRGGRDVPESHKDKQISEVNCYLVL